MSDEAEFVPKGTPMETAQHHCWEDGPPHPDDGASTTCMKADGHQGPHRWWRDDEVVFTVLPLERDEPRAKTKPRGT